MRRPPSVVSFVARTHWVVSATIAVSIVLLHLFTRKLPMVSFGPKTYIISGALALLYGAAGTLVWFGLPPGRLLSRICGLIYLARPQLGSRVWDTMDSAKFKEHFKS
jgi:hypothetical protein